MVSRVVDRRVPANDRVERQQQRQGQPVQAEQDQSGLDQVFSFSFTGSCKVPTGSTVPFRSSTGTYSLRGIPHDRSAPQDDRKAQETGMALVRQKTLQLLRFQGRRFGRLQEVVVDLKTQTAELQSAHDHREAKQLG